MVIGTATESIDADNGSGPTEQTINRQKLKLEDCWRLYDLAFFTYLDLLEAEAAEVEMATYQDHLRRYEISLEKIEALVAKRRREAADLRAGKEVRAAAEDINIKVQKCEALIFYACVVGGRGQI